MMTAALPQSNQPSEKSPGETPHSITHEGKTWTFWAAPVNLETLRASSAWQRGLSRAIVDEIKAEFNPAAVHIVVAHRPDGTETCVGGQHCSTAARELGFKSWPIAYHATVSDEADEGKLYRALLNTRRPAAVTQVEVAIVAGDPRTMAHLKVLESAGRTWARSRGKENWNAFTGLAATLWVEGKIGDKGLVAQLEFANHCWPDQPEVCHTETVKGVYYLFRDWKTIHGHFSEQQLRGALRGGPPLKTLIDQAKMAPFLRSTSVDARAQALARVLAEFFNGRHKGYKLYHISALEPPPGPPKKAA